MRVEVHIDPDCREPRVTITAPILTDEIRDLAARLEGGGGLTGWRGETAVPLREEAILRCFAQDKGVKAQTAEGVYDLRERLYELEARLDRHTFVRISHSEIVNLRKVTALGSVPHGHDQNDPGGRSRVLCLPAVCQEDQRSVGALKGGDPMSAGQKSWIVRILAGGLAGAGLAGAGYRPLFIGGFSAPPLCGALIQSCGILGAVAVTLALFFAFGAAGGGGHSAL